MTTVLVDDVEPTSRRCSTWSRSSRALKFSRAVLHDLLPARGDALFFAQVYDLDYRQVSSLSAPCCPARGRGAVRGGRAWHSGLDPRRYYDRGR